MSEIASKLEACGFAISQKKYLQPSAINALRQFRGGDRFGLLKAVYYATGLLLLVPSLRVTIFIEATKR